MWCRPLSVPGRFARLRVARIGPPGARGVCAHAPGAGGRRACRPAGRPGTRKGGGPSTRPARGGPPGCRRPAGSPATAAPASSGCPPGSGPPAPGSASPSWKPQRPGHCARRPAEWRWGHPGHVQEAPWESSYNAELSTRNAGGRVPFSAKIGILKFATPPGGDATPAAGVVGAMLAWTQSLQRLHTPDPGCCRAIRVQAAPRRTSRVHGAHATVKVRACKARGGFLQLVATAYCTGGSRVQCCERWATATAQLAGWFAPRLSVKNFLSRSASSRGESVSAADPGHGGCVTVWCYLPRWRGARGPGAGQCSTIAVCRPAARVQGAVCAHMLRELCWWLCRARCGPGDPASSACVRAHLCANRECEVDRRTGPDCGGLPAAVARHTCSLRPHHGLAHRRGAEPGRAGAAGGQLPVRGPAPGLSAGRGARVQGRGRLRRPGRVHGPRQPGWCVRAAGPRRRAEGTPVTDSSLSPHTAQTCAACPPARCPSCRSRPARCPRRVGCAGRPGAAGRDAGSFAGPVAPSQLPVPAHSRTRCACATRPRRRLWPPARPRSPRRGRRWPASPGRCEVPSARLLTTPPTPHTRRHVPVFLHACIHTDRVPGPDQGRAAPDAGGGGAEAGHGHHPGAPATCCVVSIPSHAPATSLVNCTHRWPRHRGARGASDADVSPQLEALTRPAARLPYPQLKLQCRMLGIPRWPYRRLKSIRKMARTCETTAMRANSAVKRQLQAWANQLHALEVRDAQCMHGLSSCG